MTTLSSRSQLSGWGNLPNRHSLAKLLFSENIVKKNLERECEGGDRMERVTYQQEIGSTSESEEAREAMLRDS
jgi:hypothetical protein